MYVVYIVHFMPGIKLPPIKDAPTLSPLKGATGSVKLALAPVLSFNKYNTPLPPIHSVSINSPSPNKTRRKIGDDEDTGSKRTRFGGKSRRNKKSIIKTTRRRTSKTTRRR